MLKWNKNLDSFGEAFARNVEAILKLQHINLREVMKLFAVDALTAMNFLRWMENHELLRLDSDEYKAAKIRQPAGGEDERQDSELPKASADVPGPFHPPS